MSFFEFFKQFHFEGKKVKKWAPKSKEKMIVIFAPFVKFTREDDDEYALYCEHMYAKHKPFDHENPLWPAGEKPEDPYEIIELWEAFRETAFKSGDSSLEEE